jgi:Type IV secretion-system coupling protein DNA-binding domain
MGLFSRRSRPQLLVLGLTEGTWSRKPYVVPSSVLMRHMWATGATGSGKSTQGVNLIYQIAAFPSRMGLLVLDLKDALALEVCTVLPQHRLDDAFLFDAADRTFSPAFNPLAGIQPDQRSLAASEILSCLKRYFGTSWGDKQEHILRMALLALTEVPAASLLDLSRLLLTEDFRAWALSHVSNQAVRAFFASEYPSLIGARGNTTNVQPILNKLSVFTAYPELARILGQTEKSIDPREIMDAGQILCVNIPQGVLGEDGANFLASLFIARVQLAAQSRVTLAPDKRRKFVIFADEMQNYSISSFDKLVTEGRSYGVGVIAACQFDEQLPNLLRLTLEKNCAYKLACGYRETTRSHTLDLVSLQERDPEGKRITIPLTPLPPLPNRSPEQLATIRARSRQRFYERATRIDEQLARRLSAGSAEGPIKRSARTRAEPRTTQEVRDYAFFEE